MGRRKPKTLRRRMADWPPLTEAVGRCLAGWLKLCRATSRVRSEGWEDVLSAVEAHGAVIVIFWHQRTFGAAYSLDPTTTPARSINRDARAGRLGAAMLRRFGHETIALRAGANPLATMRPVLNELRAGRSIGMAADGPSGPAHRTKAFAAQWARASGKPIVVFGFSARAGWLWPTWDRLLCPLPFTRMGFVWRVWDGRVEKGLSEEVLAARLQEIDAAINAVTERADTLAGRVRRD